MNFAYPPPQRWQDFEQLTLEVFRLVFADPGAQANGRAGQSQSGVDIFGRLLGQGSHIGIQCKMKSGQSRDPSFFAALDEIKEEIEKAEEFRPKLDYFIMATTAVRDADLQCAVAHISESRVRKAAFPVGIWFWEDFVGYINSYSHLAAFYAPLLRAMHGESLSDCQLLTVVSTAFSRAAFRTTAYVEVSSELRQSLLDSELVLNTGVLLDRQTRMPICRASTGLDKLANDPQGRVPIIMRAVQLARLTLDLAAQGGSSTLSNGFVMLPDAHCHKINAYRAIALRELNALLRTHGMQQVESPLLAAAISESDENACRNADWPASPLSLSPMGSPPSLTMSPPSLAACTIRPILDAAIARASLEIKDNILSVSCDDISSSAVLLLDAKAIEYVVYSVLHNAVKYSPKESSINIVVHGTSDHIDLFFENIGSLPPVHEDIWQFGRPSGLGPSTTTGRAPDGLSLYLAKCVLESHGGSISLTSFPHASQAISASGDKLSLVRVHIRLPRGSHQ